MNVLNSTQVKIIALILMTIDHISGYWLYDSTILSVLGRTAAPLFLFILVYSMRYTRNKLKFMIRLYLANIFVTLLYNASNFVLGWSSTPGILTTFLYVCVYVYLIENLYESIKNRKSRMIILWCFTLLSISAFPIWFDLYVTEHITGLVFSNYSMELGDFTHCILRSILPSIWHVDYSFIFVFMGVIWYFLNNKYLQVVVLIVFSAFSYVGAYKLSATILIDFFTQYQYLMVLASPFILVYNGKKGAGFKCFFYLYYPVHIIIIRIISLLSV